MFHFWDSNEGEIARIAIEFQFVRISFQSIHQEELAASLQFCLMTHTLIQGSWLRALAIDANELTVALIRLPYIR